jgi:hypothetical protein
MGISLQQGIANTRPIEEFFKPLPQSRRPAGFWRTAGKMPALRSVPLLQVGGLAFEYDIDISRVDQNQGHPK